MGFLDKIKDLFSDEEEVIETKEVEVEEKEEHKLPTFMRNKIEEEQRKEEVKVKEKVPSEVVSDREIVRTRTNNNSFSFPIEMDEPDVFDVPRYNSNQNVLAKKKEEEKKSTLYSKKEEVKITKNADKKRDDDNLLSDMLEERTSSENVSIGDAEENYFDFGVSYEQPRKDSADVIINANNVNLDAGDSEIKIVNHNMEEASAEKIEVKEEPPKRETSNKKLEDTIEFEKNLIPEEEAIDILNNYSAEDNKNEDNDIFNLIDSMYDEEEK